MPRLAMKWCLRSAESPKLDLSSRTPAWAAALATRLGFS
jgi:hypothetical protein